MRSRAGVEAHIRATPIEGSPAERRAAFRALAGSGPTGRTVSHGGVPCRAFGNGPPVVWLHGGGYMFGDSESHANCAAYLAGAAGCRVIVPDYRLAPEHPWSAQREDVLAVLNAIGLDVPLVGDSAGGHLALVIATQTQANPSSIALISPNTDRTGLSTTRQANTATDLMNDDETDRTLARIAFGVLPPDNPQVSPLLGDLSRLPPTYLTASDVEVLAGDTALLNRAARAQGADITTVWKTGLFHMWTLWPEALPAARETLQDIATHLQKHRP